MGLLKGNFIDTVTLGGHTRPWKSGYKWIEATANTTTNLRATFREFGATAGYSPAAGFKVLGMRIILNEVGTASYARAGMSRTDNDVGYSASTAFTNPVLLTPVATFGVISATTTTSGGATKQDELDFGQGYTVAAAKYLSCSVDGTAGVTPTILALVEEL